MQITTMVETSGADTLDDHSPCTDREHGVSVVTKESSTSDNCVAVYDNNTIKVQELAHSCSELVSSLVYKQ